MPGLPAIWAIKGPSWIRKDKVVYPLALLIRILLILVGEWQDRNLSIPYTDVDYEVVTDAAQLIVQGDSPYNRATYRYSPLLAYILIPNILVFQCWGKVLFSIADLAVGRCLQSILTRNGLSSGAALGYASLWLLNPLSINVSTRGSFDAVTSALVLGTTALLEDSLCWAAIAFGLVVHLRIYPIIYAPAFVLHIAGSGQFTARKQSSRMNAATGAWRNLFSRRPMIFALLSATTFLLCTVVCTWTFGMDFLRDAMLYHLTRTDNRHNYSIYWYWIYLDYRAHHRWLLGLAAFVPQAALLMAAAGLLFRDLALCIFVQTSTFVFFNKVFTGQYMTWYLCFVPIIAPRLIPGPKTVRLLCGWVCALVLWLFVAWNLEMRGLNTFCPLWICSVSFFVMNLVTLNSCLRACSTSKLTH